MFTRCLTAICIVYNISPRTLFDHDFHLLVASSDAKPLMHGFPSNCTLNQRTENKKENPLRRFSLKCMSPKFTLIASAKYHFCYFHYFIRIKRYVWFYDIEYGNIICARKDTTLDTKRNLLFTASQILDILFTSHCMLKTRWYIIIYEKRKERKRLKRETREEGIWFIQKW